MLHGTAAKGFGLQTSAYEAVRPGYTDEVLQYAVQATGLGKGEGKRVLDVGAGTGKLTRQLAAHLPHAHITAVEPVAAMRDAFQHVLPSITVLDAPASQLPFESGSVDCVFVAQAFHWFCDEVSLQELHRVLRPGGWLCLVWNMEDEGEPLVAALRAVYERYDEGIPQYRLGAWKQVFRGDWALQAFERPGGIVGSTEAARTHLHNDLGRKDADASSDGVGSIGAVATGSVGNDIDTVMLDGGAGGTDDGSRKNGGADTSTGAEGSLGAIYSAAPACNGGSLSPDDPAAQVLSSHYLRDRSCWATPQQIWQRVLSKSYVAVLPPEEQDRLRYEIMEVIRQHAAAFKPLQDGAAAAEGHGVGPAVDVWGGVDPTWVACVPIRTEVVLCRKRQPL